MGEGVGRGRHPDLRFCFLSFLLLLACAEAAPEPAFIAGVQRPACVPLSGEALADVPVHEIEIDEARWVVGTSRAPLDRVMDAAFLPDGDLLILNHFGNTIQVHDGATGAQIGTVGGEGQGPGEFRQVFFLTVHSDGGLAIPDYQNGRLVTYGPGFVPGGVVPEPIEETLPSLASAHGLTEDGAVVVDVSHRTGRNLSGGASVEEIVGHLLLVRDSLPPDTLAAIPHYRASLEGLLISGPPGRPSRSVPIRGDRIGWVEPDGLSISVRHSRADSVACVEWRGPVPATGRTRFDPDDERDLRLMEILRSEGLGPFDPPVFRDLRLTPEGGSIVEIGVHLPDAISDVEEWVVLSGDGTPRHRVRLGADDNFTMLAADAGRILLLWRDEFRVEYIGLFEIPGG